MYDAFFGDGQKLDTPNGDSSLSKERASNLGSAMMSTNEELSKLPPTLIIVSGVDLLQDEGEQFGHKLQAVELAGLKLKKALA
jgi:acetyl esterase/lipase